MPLFKSLTDLARAFILDLYDYLTTPPTVTVCEACLRAGCWQGTYWCIDAHGGYDRNPEVGSVEMTVEELAALGREDPALWRRSKGDKGTGDGK